jgi:hypothetical protein
MFTGVSTETDGIPSKYLEPPIKITSNEFELDINDKNKQFMILSFHTPLNISLLTTAPLGWALNPKSIANQYINLYCLINRVPIVIIDSTTKKSIVTFFSYLMHDQVNTVLNQYWKTIDINQIEEKFNNFSRIKNRLMPYTDYVEENNERKWNATESLNAIYHMCYADGQFSGVISPQENDFWQDNDENKVSDFNDVSFLKCIFQIAMLGAVYSAETKFYTLTNAAVFINYAQADDIKFSGKYWYKPITRLDDDKNTPTTAALVSRMIQRFESDEPLKKKTFDEIGVNMAINLNGIDVAGGPKHESSTKDVANPELKSSIELVKKLFLSTIGLEGYLKENFALSFAGIYGHAWDKLLRFFQFNQDEKVSFKQIQKAKEIIPSSSLIQHYGTPIASYIYDLKDKNIQNNTLQGYNALNFGKVLNENLISVSDKLKQKVVYTPMITPNALIPITFSTSLLQCKTFCYRNYKHLLAFMKSRKQRDYLFDKLTHYGRRAMTVLDPYGIFMHFHEAKKGIEGN